ncbi:MAG: NUDIX domain-containing protein [Oscillospiraceae bacterium]
MGDQPQRTASADTAGLLKATWPGKWSPAGGAVVAGENCLQGAVRELEEETGISAREEELLLLHSFSGDHYFLDSYLVCKDIPLERLVLQPGETIDAKWVSLSELEAMMQEGLTAEPMENHIPPVWQKLVAALEREQRPSTE